MNETIFRSLKSRAGISLIEVMLSVAIVGVVISMTFVPMVQFKKTEKMADFQSSIDLQHQIAIQKARNITYLKKLLAIDPNVDTSTEPKMPAFDVNKLKCFQQAGTNCDSFAVSNKNAENPEIFRSGNLSGTSTITLSVNCTPTTCSSVGVQVVTKEGGAPVTNSASAKSGAATTGVTVRSRTFRSLVNASSLASRSDINFTSCASNFLTGVGFKDLKGLCTGFVGITSCNGSGNRPMMLFGQTGPEVCQVTANTPCKSYGYASGGVFQDNPNCSGGGVAPITVAPSPIPNPSATPTSSPNSSPTPTPTPTPTPVPKLTAPTIVCTTTSGASGVSINVKSTDTLNCTLFVDSKSDEYELCSNTDINACTQANTSSWVPTSTFTSGSNLFDNWKTSSKFSAAYAYTYNGMTPEHAKYWGAVSKETYLFVRSARTLAPSPKEYSSISSPVGIRFTDVASAAPDFYCTVTDAGGKVTDSRKDGMLTAKLGSTTDCFLSLKAPSTKWAGAFASSADFSNETWISDTSLMTSVNGFPAWTGSNPNFSYTFKFVDCAKNPHSMTSPNYWRGKGISDTGLESAISNSVAIQYMCDDSPPVMSCTATTVDGKIINSTPTSFDVPFGATWSCTLKFASGGRTIADGKWVYWGEAAIPPKTVDLTGAALRHSSDFKSGWAFDGNGVWKPSAADDSNWIRATETNDGSPHPLGLLPGPATACFQIGDLINQKTSSIMCFNVGGPDYSAVLCPTSGPSAATYIPVVSSGQSSAKCGTCDANTKQCLPGETFPGKFLNPGDTYKMPDGTIVTCKAELTSKAAPPSTALSCDRVCGPELSPVCKVIEVCPTSSGGTRPAGAVFDQAVPLLTTESGKVTTVAQMSLAAKNISVKDSKLYSLTKFDATNFTCTDSSQTTSWKPDPTAATGYCESTKLLSASDPKCSVQCPAKAPSAPLYTGGISPTHSYDPGIGAFYCDPTAPRYYTSSTASSWKGLIAVDSNWTPFNDQAISGMQPVCVDVSCIPKQQCTNGKNPNWLITCYNEQCANNPLQSAVNAAYNPTAGVYGLTVYDNNYPNTAMSSTYGPLMTCDDTKVGTNALLKMQSCGSNNFCGGAMVGYQCACGDGPPPPPLGCDLGGGSAASFPSDWAHYAWRGGETNYSSIYVGSGFYDSNSNQTCQADAIASKHHLAEGESLTLNDTNGDRTGSITFTCSGSTPAKLGTLNISGSCSSPPPPTCPNDNFQVGSCSGAEISLGVYGDNCSEMATYFPANAYCGPVAQPSLNETVPICCFCKPGYTYNPSGGTCDSFASPTPTPTPTPTPIPTPTPEVTCPGLSVDWISPGTCLGKACACFSSVTQGNVGEVKSVSADSPAGFSGQARFECLASGQWSEALPGNTCTATPAPQKMCKKALLTTWLDPETNKSCRGTCMPENAGEWSACTTEISGIGTGSATIYCDENGNWDIDSIKNAICK